ncbi:helix-turn-helix transcriptional regulator [Streptomyces sp. NPDC058992]|uniref:helix-turn-helix transcriptional regulator n=1 Tax=unclassified Streptomyces TaxID=2593676 RepID=UPI0036882811
MTGAGPVALTEVPGPAATYAECPDPATEHEPEACPGIPRPAAAGTGGVAGTELPGPAAARTGGVVRTEFRTRRAEEAGRILGAAHGLALRLVTAADGPEYGMVRTDAGAFADGAVSLPARIEFITDEVTALTVVAMSAGLFERTAAGVDERFGAGDVLLVRPGGRSCFARHSDTRFTTVNLSAALLAQAAAVANPRRPGLPRFTGSTPLDTSLAALWTRTRSFVAETLASGVTSPLVLGQAGRLLAATALAVFPNTATTADGSSPADTRDATPDTLRRAIAFIDAHAHTDVSLADIAAAVYVTPRALQYAFRGHADTTPLTYLRRVRLARAHADLEAADPRAGVTVAGIATRWGFAHQGRFAAAYRRMYGTSPGATLRS